jgi:oligopeptide/dipeptide ABC transporter ATP-binding protein
MRGSSLAPAITTHTLQDDLHSGAFARVVHDIALSNSALQATRLPRVPDRRIPGIVTSPYNLPTGCMFHPRCPKVMDHCSVQVPVLDEAALESMLAGGPDAVREAGHVE